jgi:hypothetical protein
MSLSLPANRRLIKTGIEAIVSMRARIMEQLKVPTVAF